MKLRHKPSSDDLEPEAGSSSESSSQTAPSGSNWKCPSCGAENEDFRKFCDGCGDKRPGANVPTKGIAMDDIFGSGSPESSTAEDSGRKSGKSAKPKKSKKSKKKDDDEETVEPERLQPSTPSSEPPTEPFQTATPQTSKPADSFEDNTPSGPSDTFGSKPSFVLTGPEPTPTSEPFSSPKDTFSSVESSTTLPSPSTPSMSGQRWYLVFVNTPASSLIKTKVAVEFDDFPTVSIGRSPENVIVIPDPEVSRKHASLTFDGNRILLKDLGSSNGSFIYNGKEFERVSDSVEVRPNTVLKFGTGTIVKLVSE